LAHEIARMQDRAGSTVFILSADACKKDGFAGARDRHRLEKASFGPLGIGVILLLIGRRILCLRKSSYGTRDENDGTAKIDGARVVSPFPDR
jgi:hypothetical protein